MRSFSTGVAVTALLAGLGVALAQQPGANDKLQQPQAESAQKNWQQTEQGKAGKEEPSSHLPSDQPATCAHGTSTLGVSSGHSTQCLARASLSMTPGRATAGSSGQVSMCGAS